MYDDILGEINNEKLTDEQMFEEFDHAAWCSIYAIKILNQLVDKDLIEEKILEITPNGHRLLDLYWEKQGREPTDEDMITGMERLTEMGMV